MKHLVRLTLLLWMLSLASGLAHAHEVPSPPGEAAPPTLILSVPNGGDVFGIGSQVTIMWTSADLGGDTIEIDLMSSDGLTVVDNLATGETDDGTFSWDTAGQTAGDYRIRVSATGDAAINDQSDTPFTLAAPTLTVITPNGGDTIALGTSTSITWSSTDLGGDTVEIDLMSSDGLTVVDNLATGETDDGTFSWDTAGQAVGDYRIRVSATGDAAINDQSDAPFTLAVPAITVTAPNGGEAFNIDTDLTITWTSVALGGSAVEIALMSSDGLSVVASLTLSTPDDGIFVWNPSGQAEGDYRIRVRATNDTAIADQSDTAFTLTTFTPVLPAHPGGALLHLTAPDGGELIRLTEAFTITWATTAAVTGTVELDLMDSAGTTLQSPIANAEANDGAYVWDTAGLTPGDYRVRISATSDAGITDQSDAPFTLAVPSITVTAPNGGEDLNLGSDVTITWTSANLGGDTVDLDLLDGGGTVVTSIADSAADDGSFTWAPVGIADGSYRVRVSATTNASFADQSDALFTVTSHTPVLPAHPGGALLHLTAPDGGELIRLTEAFTITWATTAAVTGTVELDLMDSAGTTLQSSIADDEANDGSYVWDTAGLTPGDYRVRISATSDAGITDQSDAPFTLAVPSITVTAPNGGEDLSLGSDATITWTSANLGGDTVDLDLLDSGGTVVTSIADSAADDGSFTWAPVGIADGSYRVRVSATTNASFADQSDALFTVTSHTPVLPAHPGGALLHLTAPDGGEVLNVGNVFAISWASTAPVVGTVELDLMDSAGTTLQSPIADAEANDGAYVWDTSGLTPGDYRVRISATSDAGVHDQSDAAFTLVAPVTVTAPNGGETWTAGTTETITWTDDLAGNVRIQLFKNGSFDRTIASSTPSDGSHDYAVPPALAPGTDYTVRIRSVDDPSIFDDADATFTVEESIVVTSPAPGTAWTAGTVQNVTWTTNVPTEAVRVLLFKGGVFHQTLEVSTPNDGFIFFPIPTTLTPANDYTIRVRLVSDATVRDDSPAFEIVTGETITVTGPNGGETWQAGTTQTITWTDSFPENVRLMLFKDGGYFRMIAGSTPGDGSFDWTIPSGLAPGTTYTIRARKADNYLVRDDSDAVFEIIAPLAAPVLMGAARSAGTALTAEVLRWQPVEGATGYRVEVAPDTAFAPVLVTATLDGGVTQYAAAEALEAAALAKGGVTAGRAYAARVRAEADGAHSAWTEAALTTEAPEAFALDTNYPNPFNPTTTIRYALKASGAVRLVVFDVLGREVARLVDGPQSAGRYAFRFDATGLPSGVYFAHLHAAGFAAVRPMLLTK